MRIGFTIIRCSTLGRISLLFLLSLQRGKQQRQKIQPVIPDNTKPNNIYIKGVVPK